MQLVHFQVQHNALQTWWMSSALAVSTAFPESQPLGLWSLLQRIYIAALGVGIVLVTNSAQRSDNFIYLFVLVFSFHSLGSVGLTGVSHQACFKACLLSFLFYFFFPVGIVSELKHIIFPGERLKVI